MLMRALCVVDASLFGIYVSAELCGSLYARGSMCLVYFLEVNKVYDDIQ